MKDVNNSLVFADGFAQVRALYQMATVKIKEDEFLSAALVAGPKEYASSIWNKTNESYA